MTIAACLWYVGRWIGPTVPMYDARKYIPSRVRLNALASDYSALLTGFFGMRSDVSLYLTPLEVLSSCAR